MNNLSEKLEDLVKQDTMKYMYGGKKTLFTEAGIKQLNIKRSKMINTIHALDAHVTTLSLENIDRTKYIVFN